MLYCSCIEQFCLLAFTVIQCVTVASIRKRLIIKAVKKQGKYTPIHIAYFCELYCTHDVPMRLSHHQVWIQCGIHVYPGNSLVSLAIWGTRGQSFPYEAAVEFSLLKIMTNSGIFTTSGDIKKQHITSQRLVVALCHNFVLQSSTREYHLAVFNCQAVWIKQDGLCCLSNGLT